MSFDPSEFAILAESLITPEAQESHLRTAIGRLYYCAFLTARERLRRLGLLGRQQRTRIHKAVIDSLRERPGYRATGDILGRLLGLREQADYYLIPSSPVYADWKKNWLEAKTMFDTIRDTIQKL